MTDADLLKALKTAWDDQPVLGTLCPGGVHLNRADKDAEAPYAVVTIRELEPNFHTESVVFRSYLVSLAVYSETGAYDTKDVAEQLQAAFGDEVAVDEALCLAVYRAAGEFRHEEARRDQDDVVRMTVAWRMNFQTPV